MNRFLSNARFATILAVALALLVSGVVAGAAGSALLLGRNNTAGTSSTVVTSSNGGQTLFAQNTGAGWAVRGLANSGIGGLFQSTTSTGMAGFTGTADKYAVVGTQNASSFGGGAAVLGDGRNNDGVSGTTSADEADAVRGVNLATDASVGSANGVYGESRASGGNGVVGTVEEDTGVNFGVWGINNSPAGVAVTASDFSDGGLAGDFFGDVVVDGDIQVGSCTGCTTVLAVETSEAVAQGDAVAIAGVTTGPTGAPMLIVRRATAGDQVIGLADRSISLVANPRTGSQRMVRGEAGATAGGTLLIVTDGLLAVEANAAMTGLAAGTELTTTGAGALTAAPAGAASIGFVAGTLDDGRSVIYVNP